VTTSAGPAIATSSSRSACATAGRSRCSPVHDATHDPLTGTASIGIVVITDADVDASQVLRRADGAMFVAKARGGNSYAWSDPSESGASSRRLTIETALGHAIERRELSLAFQPLQSFADDRPFAVEALLRWTHPDLGSVPPDEFIPIAEQTGLIGPIGSWVLRNACAALPALAGQYGDGVRLAVNVSARQLCEPGLPGCFTQTLAEHGLAADRLCVESPETALVGSDPTTTDNLRALHATGASVALDDFGTGYSSLAMLKRHPISLIKIDRSFIDELPEDRSSLAIVTALIGMGQALGLAIVAEGIETQGQWGLLSNGAKTAGNASTNVSGGTSLGTPAVRRLRSAYHRNGVRREGERGDGPRVPSGRGGPRMGGAPCCPCHGRTDTLALLRGDADAWSVTGLLRRGRPSSH